MWRRAAGAALSLGAGAGAVAIVNSEDPAATLKVCTHLPPRLLRDSATAVTAALDYKWSLWGLEPGSPEWLAARHDAHLRSANRLQELCFRNGGIYIKLGQHIAQLEYVVPEEYVQTMRESMLKRCPVSSYEQVRGVFAKDLGESPETFFAEFDPVPLASASLAQVHAAKTHDGQKVAVKVQHEHLADTSVVDIATVDLLVKALNYIFPSFDYRWLVEEIREITPMELDFINEAKNSERCLENFRRLSPHIAGSIYAPKVYWTLSTSRILTMEFMDAKEVTDVQGIKEMGIHPAEVSNLVSKAFSEMIFKHGFVHCDPHAANMMIRPVPQDSRKLFGWKRPQLILLDHGLYKELDHATRINYASLWKALVFADAKAIKEYSVKLGAGEDLHALFAGVLTMRPWQRVIDPSLDHLVLDGKNTDNSELQVIYVVLNFLCPWYHGERNSEKHQSETCRAMKVPSYMLQRFSYYCCDLLVVFQITGSLNLSDLTNKRDINNRLLNHLTSDHTRSKMEWKEYMFVSNEMKGIHIHESLVYLESKPVSFMKQVLKY